MIQSPYSMQLVLGVKSAEIIAYEIKGNSLYKKGRGPHSILSLGH